MDIAADVAVSIFFLSAGVTPYNKPEILINIGR